MCVLCSYEKRFLSRGVVAVKSLQNTHHERSKTSNSSHRRPERTQIRQPWPTPTPNDRSGRSALPFPITHAVEGRGIHRTTTPLLVMSWDYRTTRTLNRLLRSSLLVAPIRERRREKAHQSARSKRNSRRRMLQSANLKSALSGWKGKCRRWQKQSTICPVR